MSGNVDLVNPQVHASSSSRVLRLDNTWLIIPSAAVLQAPVDGVGAFPFPWLPAGDASTVAQEWERRGLPARSFPCSGLRVTVGSPEVNDLLISAAEETAPPAR